MVNDILDGITNALHDEFGDTFSIYTEKVKQGLQVPCFFVSCISPKDERWLGNRRKLTNQFTVQYLPGTDEPKRECNAVSERLVCALEYIQLSSGCLGGTNMQPAITDDVLTMSVNYNLYAYMQTDIEPTMNDIKTEGGLR